MEDHKKVTAMFGIMVSLAELGFLLQNGKKMAKITKIQYRMNGWSYEVRSSLILSERGIFLLVFYIIYTPQTNRNG